MEMKNVESSYIRKVGFDQDRGEILVQFMDGFTAAYRATSKEYNDMINGVGTDGSIGRWFNANLKKRTARRI